MSFVRKHDKEDSYMIRHWEDPETGDTLSVQKYEAEDSWDAKKNRVLLESFDDKEDAIERVEEEMDSVKLSQRH